MSKNRLDLPTAFDAVHSLLRLAEATFLVREHALLLGDDWRDESVRMRSRERGWNRVQELVDDAAVRDGLLSELDNGVLPDGSPLEEELGRIESYPVAGPVFKRVLAYARGVVLVLAENKHRSPVIGRFHGSFMEERELANIMVNGLRRELEAEQARLQDEDRTEQRRVVDPVTVGLAGGGGTGSSTANDPERERRAVGCFIEATGRSDSSVRDYKRKLRDADKSITFENLMDLFRERTERRRTAPSRARKSDKT